MDEDQVLRHVHIDTDDPVDVALLKAVKAAGDLLYGQPQPFRKVVFAGLNELRPEEEKHWATFVRKGSIHLRCGECEDQEFDRKPLEVYGTEGIHNQEDDELVLLTFLKCPSCGHRVIMKEIGDREV